jgi:hypothetical protein
VLKKWTGFVSNKFLIILNWFVGNAVIPKICKALKNIKPLNSFWLIKRYWIKNSNLLENGWSANLGLLPRILV